MATLPAPSPIARPSPAGLVVAAGAGSRMGMPKALVISADGVPWLGRATRLLLDAGCDPVVVVLGAEADAARALVPEDPRVHTVVAADWVEGMGASLSAGMRTLLERWPEALAAVITLVDLPGLTVEVVERVTNELTATSLRRASFGGRPGHPVAVGRDHWSAFTDSLGADEGGRTYLTEQGAALVECGDLADGRDVDTRVRAAHEPDSLPARTAAIRIAASKASSASATSSTVTDSSG